MRCYEEHENEIIAALEADLRRPKQESLIVETEFMKNDIKHILYHLNDWVKAERVSSDIGEYFRIDINVLVYFFW